MSPLIAFFSFSGTMSRRWYLLYGLVSLVMFAFVTIVASKLGQALAAQTSFGMTGQTTVQLVTMSIIGVPIKVAMGLVLAVKRLRHIGIDVHNAGWMVLSMPVASILHQIGWDSLTGYMWLLTAASIASTIYLVFAPGKAGSGSALPKVKPVVPPPPSREQKNPFDTGATRSARINSDHTTSPRPKVRNPAALHPAYAHEAPHPQKRRNPVMAALDEWNAIGKAFHERRRTANRQG